MSPGWETSDGLTRREPHGSRWTGVVAVAMLAYVAIAIVLILIDRSGSPVLDIFNLYSDSPPSIGVAILAAAAARGSSDPAARKTWWLFAAALAVYSMGNLLH